MAQKLYALLVGIDAYPSPSQPLRGCVNDVRAMEAFLRGRIEQQQLALRSLCDQQATRDAIITAFRHHLGEAGSGDTALFFFGGHGSQEHLPPLYTSSEPDQLSETLVAYDSRQEGGWDLADKELAVLVAEVAARGPHVVIVLDSCHPLAAHPTTAHRRSPAPAEGVTRTQVRLLRQFIGELDRFIPGDAFDRMAWPIPFEVGRLVTHDLQPLLLCDLSLPNPESTFEGNPVLVFTRVSKLLRERTSHLEAPRSDVAKAHPGNGVGDHTRPPQGSDSTAADCTGAWTAPA